MRRCLNTNYSTTKKYRQIKEKIIDFLLFPVFCICTPIYKLYQKYQENKRYSDKQIRKAIQYTIDYWMDYEEDFYIIFYCFNPVHFSPIHEQCENVKTPWDMYNDIVWGWNGENKKMKNKLQHIWYYQEEQYLKIFKEMCLEICKNPMTLEEKKVLNKYYFYDFKDIETYFLEQ